MIAALAGVAACTVAGVLLLGFAEHLRAPRALPGALAAHGTVPLPLVRPLAVIVVAVEGLLGAALTAGLATGADRLPGLLVAAGVLLAVYATYAHRLRRGARGRAVPCGCSGADTAVNGWVVLRAGVPSALALAAAPVSGAVVVPAASAARFAEAALAGAVFAVLLWALPEAMARPAAEGGGGGRGGRGGT
ncbi:MauE/DoxX family redox-associated membrane protein [Thermomonospora cellulosilytica]|uniref:Methylamine utilisation protein MauE domain-containing protein n=1 Tax=Thermomonospora cellulosilytica TaxID=1411118 RepID=A0A7W3MZS5_9ACTN|nr:MauE/DoxX family redox-associated membrane protein [Thermomonospora cellulosilytica]MBA9004894.1 hypothetical protein [Thermomonospora cellulosilytica]